MDTFVKFEKLLKDLKSSMLMLDSFKISEEDKKELYDNLCKEYALKFQEYLTKRFNS